MSDRTDKIIQSICVTEKLEEYIKKPEEIRAVLKTANTTIIELAKEISGLESENTRLKRQVEAVEKVLRLSHERNADIEVRRVFASHGDNEQTEYRRASLAAYKYDHRIGDDRLLHRWSADGATDLLALVALAERLGK